MSNELAIPQNLRELLAEEAKNEASREETGGRVVYITSRGKKWRQGDQLLPKELDVVIVANAHDKAYYDRPYNAEESSPPACFALALNNPPNEPHEASPNKQNDACKTCKWNQFGSAAIGKGKSCKDSRRFVMLNVNDKVDATQMAVYKLSPSSLKNWATYAKSVALKHEVPTSVVVTTLSIDDDADYPVINFKMKRLVDQDELNAILALKKEAEEIAMRPYNIEDYKPVEANARSKMS